MDINGASAIVTGGASGIGAAVARQLAAQGAKVVVADLNSEKGEELANEIGGAFAPVDVTKTEQIQAAIEQAEELGPIRVLVNSAGIGWAQRTVGRDGSYDSAADLDAFTKVVAINLIAAVGIRVNTVAPGLIDTPIYGEGEQSEAFKAKLGESVLFPKRLGVPDELASMVLECLTNSYMNAETIRVDGGIRMPPK